MKILVKFFLFNTILYLIKKNSWKIIHLLLVQEMHLLKKNKCLGILQSYQSLKCQEKKQLTS